MNGSSRNWKAFPATYRAREVKMMADWIRAGESGSLIGLAGAGKSNLLGFLCHQPEALAGYLGVDNSKLALIHVDLNNLPANDLATLFRVMLRSLYEAGDTISAELRPEIEVRYRKVEEKTDPFLAQSALREVLFLFKKRGMRLVLILDPFDQFCQNAATQVLDNLRGLRDSFKTTMSYIIGLRRQIGYIRDPLELGELYEIIDTHQCWLGSMEWDDARWVIGQVETATRKPFTEETVAEIINITGGYPALLKPVSFWRSKMTTIPSSSTWLSLLSVEPAVRNRLYDIRIGLTGEEESTLSILQATLSESESDDRAESLRQFEIKHSYTLKQLEEKKLCLKTDRHWQLFSPLFATYISKMEAVSAGRISFDPMTNSFWQGERKLSKLSTKDADLLEYFLSNPQSAHSTDDLIEAAWSEDDGRGVSKEAVQQAIRHLRKQIEPNPAKPCYLVTEHRIGYRFFPEGAPRG